jgi:hypothetical protein
MGSVGRDDDLIIGKLYRDGSEGGLYVGEHWGVYADHIMGGKIITGGSSIHCNGYGSCRGT